MTLRYLIDEHIASAVVRALRQREPGLIVWRIGDAGAPARGTPDVDVLAWCEARLSAMASGTHSGSIAGRRVL